MLTNIGHDERQKTPFFEKPILRLEEVSELLGFSKAHIYRLTSSGELPYRKKGKTLFFITREVLEWIDEGVV